MTRLKSNSRYEVVRSKAASGPVLADQLIRLSSPQGQTCYPELLRRVHYLDPEGQEYVFLTNRLDLPALEVAELYRRRWQIELFFKWIKQNLKIKAFYGTSKNAVLIQIWTALIAYCSWYGSSSKAKRAGDSCNSAAWPKPCSWNAWTCGLCSALDHQITDNLCYSISVPDSSDKNEPHWGNITDAHRMLRP